MCCNAAAALKDFTALKGRGARFTAGGVDVIDESYNANPASMAAALALLGSAPGRRIAVLGDMLEMGPDGGCASCRSGPSRSTPRADLVFLCGPQMKSLWERLPAKRRGAYAPNSAELAAIVAAALQSRATRCWSRVQTAAGCRSIIDALKSARLRGSMFYFLSLLTHADQLPSSACSNI